MQSHSLKKSLVSVTDNSLKRPEAAQHTVTFPAFVPAAAPVGLLSDGMQRREAVGIRHLVEGHAYEEAVWI